MRREQNKTIKKIVSKLKYRVGHTALTFFHWVQLFTAGAQSKMENSRDERIQLQFCNIFVSYQNVKEINMRTPAKFSNYVLPACPFC